MRTVGAWRASRTKRMKTKTPSRAGCLIGYPTGCLCLAAAQAQGGRIIFQDATTCCTRRWRRPATCSIRGCGRATPHHGVCRGRRVRYFGSVRMRADSGFYDQRILRTRGGVLHRCRAATQRWRRKQMERGGRSGRRRQRHENRKRDHEPDRQIASIEFRSWKQSYRFCRTRTKRCPCGLLYYTTNSKRSAAAVLRSRRAAATRRTSSRTSSTGWGCRTCRPALAANQAYFLIAALAWNLKTWMLNLLRLGDGAVLRCKRFLYLWIRAGHGGAQVAARRALKRLPEMPDMP